MVRRLGPLLFVGAGAVRALLVAALLAGCAFEAVCPPDSRIKLGDLLESNCPDPGRLRASECISVRQAVQGEGCSLEWAMICGGAYATASWDTEAREGTVSIRYPGVCSERYSVDPQ
jgi:hypothetical protein